MPTLVHIIRSSEWQQVRSTETYQPASLRTQGFIHFSSPSQVARVANALYHGQEDLLLLVVPSEQCTAPLKWENLYGGEELFPHLYGPLALTAVTAVIPFPPGTDGRFQLPPSPLLMEES
jgi:uncharacterized protein (DUF952 family)